MSKILTVVVPTYNAERFLEDNLKTFCIKTVVDEIEVLIINDGSTDGSLEIAERYATVYPETFRVITKENGGHGSGINCGIKHAKGKYFKVVDADDWVDKNAFCKLVQTLIESDADIVSSGFLWAIENNKGLEKTFQLKAEMKEPFLGVNYHQVYNFDEIAQKLYIKMHNMTIKTAILKDNNIRIDENCYYVDTEFITYPIPYIKTICFIKENVYYYRIGREGQSVSIEKIKQNEENYDRVISSLLKFYSQLSKEIPCSNAKREYLAGIIARVIAGKVKILLLKPLSVANKQALIRFDSSLKMNYPNIYYKNINCAIDILRRTNYWTYRFIGMLTHMIYRL